MNWPNFRNSSCLVIAISFFVFSCKKEKEEELYPAVVYTVEEGVRIHDIQFLSDSVWLACGGIRNEYGAIYKTYDAGTNWNRIFTTNESSIYTLELKDDHNGFAGGDFLRLWQTNDAGETWQFYWLADQVPINEEDRPAVRDILFVSDSDWYFCGGENLYKGVFYHTQDAGVTWSFNSIENELRVVVPSSNNVLIAAGHGASYNWNQQSSNFERSDFKNDFIKDAVLLTNGNVVACTEQGNLYRSTQGMHWNRIWNSSRIHQFIWNGITQREGDVLVVGAYGHVLAGDVDGSIWRAYRMSDVGHLLSVVVSNRKFYITTSDGQVLVLDRF